MNIKDKISMAEFGAIVNAVVTKCFNDGKYDPTYKEFWIKYSITSVLCDYPFENKPIEEIWDNFQTDEDIKQTWEAIGIVYSEIIAEIRLAISQNIEHKNRISSYSMTDIALSNLIEVIEEKIDNAGDIFNNENIQALTDMSKKLSKLNNVSQKKVVQTIIDSFDKRGIKKDGE